MAANDGVDQVWVCPGLIMQRGAGHADCTAAGAKISLLYGFQKQGTAYLAPTLGSCGHR